MKYIPVFIYLNPLKNYLVTVNNALSPNDTLELMALEPAQDSSSFILDSAGVWRLLDVVPYIGLNWFPHHSVEEHNALSQVACYPNPATDRITVSSVYSVLEKIIVTDITGKEVMTVACQHTHQNLDLNRLAPGVYLMRCFTNAGVDTVKLIKQ